MKTQTLLNKLKGIPKVSDLTSPRSGEAVRNQVVINMKNGEVFQSYDSTIAIKYEGKVYITSDYDYSATTSKYLKQFCGSSSKEIKEKIKSKDSRFVMLK